MLNQKTHCLITLSVLAVLLAMGCKMEERVVSSTWDQYKQWEWYEPPRSETGQNSAGGASNRGYAIELGRFTGEGAFGEVYRLMTSAREEAGLANLWYTSSGTQAKVFAGRFAKPDSPEAKSTLSMVRSAKINGKTPFEDVKIVSVTGDRSEVLDKHDLRSLSGRGLYTLQIGYYDTAFGPDFRKAAETAVNVLREQGQEAYYYHGPNRSSILINAWTYGQAFTQTIGTQDRYSFAVRAAQEKHPYNVPNGKSFTQDDDPAFVASQKSFLVPIR